MSFAIYHWLGRNTNDMGEETGMSSEPSSPCTQRGFLVPTTPLVNILEIHQRAMGKMLMTISSMYLADLHEPLGTMRKSIINPAPWQVEAPFSSPSAWNFKPSSTMLPSLSELCKDLPLHTITLYYCPSTCILRPSR